MKNPKNLKTYRVFSFFTVLSLMISILGISPFSTQASKIKLKPVNDLPTNILSATSETMFGLTTTGSLVKFNSATPGTLISNTPITGLLGGDSLVGIDFRPATGTLYGVSSLNRVYVINTNTAVATVVGTSAFTPGLNTATQFGVDFNPVPDRIRVVSNTAQNLRLNPVTGARADVPADGNLAYATGDPNQGATPYVVECAYTNNFVGATSTTLYDIDNVNATAPARLVMQGSTGGTPTSPNTGQLFTVGTISVGGTPLTVTSNAGFDISNFSTTAYAALNPTSTPTTSNLYTVNLTTGAATLVGAVGGGVILKGLTVALPGETLVALTTSGKLLTFNSGSPGTITRSVTVSGLQSGETLVGIDYRPATGDLFGVGSTNRVYKINALSGLATMVGTTPFSPGLSGTNFGVDFNPVPDRIRVVSDNTQNIRLNPDTGARADTPTPDTALAYATGDPNQGANPFVSGAAYTNSVAGATVTTLYDIDYLGGTGPARLVTQGGLNGTPSPNLGQLFTVGSTGVTSTGNVGFDISGKTGAAFASLTPTGTPSTSNLYTVNLTTGAATNLGTIAAGEAVKDITVVNNVEIVTALNTANQLITFATTAPAKILSGPTTVTGLQPSEMLLGIDFRPATGQLYGLGSTGRTYTITSTGVATQVGTATVTVNGASSYGYDFNPVPDRIRVVSNSTTTPTNFRINPNTGGRADTPTNDGALVYATGDANAGTTPMVSGAAYTNSFAGTTVTTLYDIDFGLGILARQGSLNGTPTSPNTGQLFTVGSLGVGTITSDVGFDISGLTGIAYASLNPMTMTANPGIAPAVAGTSNLYTINLDTGAASLVGAIAGGMTIRDITIGVAAANLSTQQHVALIVADTANNRLQTSFDDGATWRIIGGPGTGLGQFNAPRSVANDATGNIIFVADTANNRIQRSTNGGVSWTIIAAPGTTTGAVNAPEGVVYDQLADTLYVADTLNNRVQKFAGASATPVASVMGGPGAGLGSFNGPTGIAIDAMGQVYVCDTNNNRVQLASATGIWSLFAGPGTGLGSVNAPRGIAVDTNGRVLIADTGNNRIMTATSGVFATLFGPGTTLGTVNAPRGVTVTISNAVLVGDTGNNRVQRRTSAGIVSQVGAPGNTVAGTFNQPSGLR